MTKKNNLSIKDAFKELEYITNEFENGDLDLEQSIPKFKRGLELAKYLKTRLNEVENEIIEIKAKFDKMDNAKIEPDSGNDYDSSTHLADTNTLF